MKEQRYVRSSISLEVYLKRAFYEVSGYHVLQYFMHELSVPSSDTLKLPFAIRAMFVVISL